MSEHAIECQNCVGGKVELCPRHSGNCPCRTIQVDCTTCDGRGELTCDDDDCSLCLQVAEDFSKVTHA